MLVKISSVLAVFICVGKNTICVGVVFASELAKLLSVVMEISSVLAKM